jgi:hypothetical protein
VNIGLGFRLERQVWKKEELRDVVMCSRTLYRSKNGPGEMSKGARGVFTVIEFHQPGD